MCVSEFFTFVLRKLGEKLQLCYTYTCVFFKELCAVVLIELDIGLCLAFFERVIAIAFKIILERLIAK